MIVDYQDLTAIKHLLPFLACLKGARHLVMLRVMLSVTIKPFKLSVIMPIVVMASVMAPKSKQQMKCKNATLKGHFHILHFCDISLLFSLAFLLETGGSTVVEHSLRHPKV